MWIEKSELESLAKEIRDIFGIIPTIEEKEKNREIRIKISSTKPNLEALVREIEPATPSTFSLKYEEKEGERYKVSFEEFSNFVEDVREGARLLHIRLWNIEEKLSRIMDKNLW